MNQNCRRQQDLTVIDLMSIVHMDIVWLKLQKILRCGRPGGGVSVISDTPDEGGGSIKGKFLRTSFIIVWRDLPTRPVQYGGKLLQLD